MASDLSTSSSARSSGSDGGGGGFLPHPYSFCAMPVCVVCVYVWEDMWDAHVQVCGGQRSVLGDSITFLPSISRQDLSLEPRAPVVG